MQKDPELFRIYNVTNYHCRHFVRKGEAGDGIYCDYTDYPIYHMRSIRLKITKANTGIFLVWQVRLMITAVYNIYHFGTG